MQTIDGTLGCGGGHVLRTALAISAATGSPLHLVRFRLDRDRPGLMRHHLSAVQAARQLCDAAVEGAQIGAQELRFTPGPPRHGEHTLRVGAARSAMLLLDVALPALLRATGPSTLRLEGGTHTADAPSFYAWQRALAPLLHTLGAPLQLDLRAIGFAPAAGGVVEAHLTPPTGGRLSPLLLHERGELLEASAEVSLAHLRPDIARRELDILQEMLNWPPERLHIREHHDARGPGNAVCVTLRSERVTEVFSGVGARGVRAEQVAEQVAHATRRYLAANVPIGRDLAERLTLLAATAGHGADFLTLPPSQRLQTTAELINRTRCAACRLERREDRVWRVLVEPV